MKPLVSDIMNQGESVKKGVTEKDVDPIELKKGIKIEMEHTNNPVVSKKIALDHLAEHPKGYYKGLIELEDRLNKKAEDLTTPNLIKHKDDHSEKKTILNINRVIRLASSPNKARAIENTIIGNITHGLVGVVSKLAAAEGFRDEMEKISHSIEQIWSKVSPLQKAFIGIKRPGLKADMAKMLESGKQMAAMRSLDATIGRPLSRVSDRPSAIEPFYPQKNTYRKPGGF